MKSFFALAVATSALATAHAVDCDVTKLVPLLQDTDVKKCGTETGLQPPVPPTADILPKLCGNTACQSALTKLKGLNVGDCVVAGVALETNFIKPIEKYCATNNSPASATTAPAPATSPSPTPAGSKTPAPSSVAPTPTSSTSVATTTTPSTSKPSGGSGSGSDTTVEDTKNPINVPDSSSSSSSVPAMATPTPSPSSGASSVALAASAVVLAVIATFM